MMGSRPYIGFKAFYAMATEEDLPNEGKNKGESWEDGFKRRVVKQQNLTIKKMVIIGELKVRIEKKLPLSYIKRNPIIKNL